MKRILSCWLFISLVCAGISAQTNKTGKSFTEDLMQDSCSFATTGRNAYFILEPNFQMILEGKVGKDFSRLVITVLDEIKKIGNTETRIIKENESLNGKTVEISRNYFAFCKQTSSIYYFGKEVDIYRNGTIVNREGA